MRGWFFKLKINCGFVFNRRKIDWSTSVRKCKHATIAISHYSRIAEMGKIVVYDGGTLVIGENTSIDRLCEIIIEKDSSLKIGDNVFIGSHANIRVTGNMEIGNDCRIAQFVSLINGNYGFVKKDILIRNQQYEKGFLLIEDDVWIGVGSIILPNLTISKGAVLGAGTVISKDVPEYSVVVGNPQKIIKARE
jgi:acetyltransferase-like isoleucine patch superfamily enzyme